MAAEAEGEDIEDKYVTACYILMENFGYTLQELADTPATTFNILLEEMKKKADREKEEMNRNKRFR